MLLNSLTDFPFLFFQLPSTTLLPINNIHNNDFQYCYLQRKARLLDLLGASGDLAKKKTFPALFGLFLHGHIAPTTRIVGYARTKMDRPDYLKRISQYIKNKTTPKVKVMLDQFLDQCTYVSGVYDQDSGFQALEQELQRVEKETKTYDRLFYMALPPSVFIPVANGLKKNCYTLKGINRLIVEKPFGMDLESSRTLSKALGALFREDEVRFGLP
ncbi:Glucose-6-phosphate 1-dehydrogenase [Mortierella sp. AM989]|nr:Glucose-6-phosphate 1-dehydrogenase [Mortierella sp. AM989]